MITYDKLWWGPFQASPRPGRLWLQCRRCSTSANFDFGQIRLSGFVCDGPETSIGESAAPWWVQFDASAAGVGRGITTRANSTGWFIDVQVSQSPNRGAAPRHRQEVTQPASSTPWEAPPPLSPIPTQPMEPTSAPTTGDAAIPTVPPRAPPREAPSRYSQGTTQPGPPPPGASRVT